MSRKMCVMRSRLDGADRVVPKTFSVKCQFVNRPARSCTCAVHGSAFQIQGIAVAMWRGLDTSEIKTVIDSSRGPSHYGTSREAVEAQHMLSESVTKRVGPTYLSFWLVPGMWGLRAHPAAAVNDERHHLLGHCLKCVRTTNKVSKKSFL